MVIFNSYVNLPEGMPFYMYVNVCAVFHIRSFVHRKYGLSNTCTQTKQISKNLGLSHSVLHSIHRIIIFPP